MSEHPGLEFAPQSPRSQISPSMPPLVLFIISMAITRIEKNKTSGKYINRPLHRPLNYCTRIYTDRQYCNVLVKCMNKQNN